MNRVIHLSMALALIALAGGCARDGAGEAQQETARADLCAEHRIAASRCPFCNPGLIEAMGPCREHGVPEALCHQCTPALVAAFKAEGDWCAEHDRPESQCSICNPELDPVLVARVQDPAPGEPALARPSEIPPPGVERAAGEIPPQDGRWSQIETLPRAARPPSVACETERLVVRFDSPEIAGQAGLEFSRAGLRPITKSIECNALIAYDRSRYARLASQVPGIVEAVHKDFGQPVAKGERLAVVNSPALGAAKAAFLRARASVELWEQNHAQEADLLERGVATEREVLEARMKLAQSRIELSTARGELLGLGLSESQIEQVARTEDTSSRYVLAAPFAGVVVERWAVIGEVVDPLRVLFGVADLSRMWALLDLYEADAREVSPGRPVVVRAEGLPGESFAGTITWVSSEVDPRTRTLPARAEIANPQGLLRANMFARAVVSVRDRHPALVVPEDAVQWEGCCNIVFVRRSDVLFEPRKVHLGISTGRLYEVLSGLEPGEEIVTQGSFLLKTEILKGSIGAGCCEVVPGT